MIGSCLLQYGYSFKSKNNCCSVYMNKTFDGHTPNENFLLYLDCSDTHIHNIEAKRCKVDNDSATYLWHCRLGHIGVKRMKKLHADGLLESLYYESLDACEPCLMGKMAKTPFSGTIKRATDFGNNTYWCMRSDECWGSRRVSLFSDLHRWFEQIWVYLLNETQSETFEKFI